MAERKEKRAARSPSGFQIYRYAISHLLKHQSLFVIQKLCIISRCLEAAALGAVSLLICEHVWRV
jgi:hypothetical protein